MIGRTHGINVVRVENCTRCTTGATTARPTTGQAQNHSGKSRVQRRLACAAKSDQPSSPSAM